MDDSRTRLRLADNGNRTSRKITRFGNNLRATICSAERAVPHL